MGVAFSESGFGFGEFGKAPQHQASFRFARVRSCFIDGGAGGDRPNLRNLTAVGCRINFDLFWIKSNATD
jgi:hypothetical protein